MLGSTLLYFIWSYFITAPFICFYMFLYAFIGSIYFLHAISMNYNINRSMTE